MGEVSLRQSGFDIDHVLKHATVAEKLALLAGKQDT